VFREKPKDGGRELVSGGFFVFNKKFFQYLTPDVDCDLEYGPLERIAQQGQLMVYKHKGFWFCMDTQRDMDALNEMWRTGSTPWTVWKQ
jgi:glucose-1-phosphate cytidylyltransferase